jgi:hypothetical protein
MKTFLTKANRLGWLLLFKPVSCFEIAKHKIIVMKNHSEK